MDDLDQGFETELSPEDRLIVRYRPGFATKPSYVISLRCEIQGKWYEVIRADDWDTRPHFDRTSPDGTVKKQWTKETGDNLRNYQDALDWIQDNWYNERERYESEMD